VQYFIITEVNEAGPVDRPIRPVSCWTRPWCCGFGFERSLFRLWISTTVQMYSCSGPNDSVQGAPKSEATV